MKTQKEIFSENEADAWLERNRRTQATFNPAQDPVVRHLRPHLRPGMAVAEVGCSLASRVAALAKITAGPAFGIDPSARGIAEAARLHPHVSFAQSSAEKLPWADKSLDVLVYGFCLYVCDRADLFDIASEGDRVLTNGGLLAILDFHPPMPYRNRYSHLAGLFSYKMDHARLWTWNPAYVEISRELIDHNTIHTSDPSTFAPDERVAVTVLKKMPAYAYPLSPSYANE